MARVRKLQRRGNGYVVLMDDGERIACYPTPTGVYVPRRGAVVPDPDPVDPTDPTDPEPNPGGGSAFKWPMNPSALNTRNGRPQDGYMTAGRPTHNGIDMSFPPFTNGMPIRAIADGTVVRAYWEPGGGGWFVELAHGSRWRSGYAHGGTNSASSFQVWNGKSVKQGDHLMNAGQTGQSTGPHLHFMMVDMNRTGAFWSSHVNPITAMATLNPNDEYV